MILQSFFNSFFLLIFWLRNIVYKTIYYSSVIFLTHFSLRIIVYTIIYCFHFIFHSKLYFIYYIYYIYYYITILLHFSHSKSYYIILLYYYFHFIFLTQKYKICSLNLYIISNTYPYFHPKKYIIFHSRLIYFA